MALVVVLRLPVVLWVSCFRVLLRNRLLGCLCLYRAICFFMCKPYVRVECVRLNRISWA
jgi:hypothetical protein